MNPYLAQIQEVISTTEKLAGKDDRWLMIFLIVVLLGFAGWLIRYMTTNNEKLQTQAAEQNQRHTATITNLFEKSNESAKTMAVALDRNSKILERYESRVG